MTITNLRLAQFRNFYYQSFDFSRGINIIIGPNAVGKTSLLEAIYLMCTGSTFRAEENLVQEGQKWARIDINYSDNKTRTLKITGDNKLFEEEKQSAKRPKRPVILFEPNELFLFYQNPNARREYVDTRVASAKRGYSNTVTQYKRALAHRNKLLKTRRGATETMFVWDLKLAELGQQIATERKQYVSQLNKHINPIYQKISNHKEEVSVEYVSSLSVDSSYTTNLLKKLQDNLHKDFETGYTNFGPHRDDIAFKIFGKGVKTIASRGEIRTIMLAMKKIEADQLENPVILLDDVFSELDSLRRQRVVGLFGANQVFITTTEADLVIKKLSAPHSTIVF